MSTALELGNLTKAEFSALSRIFSNSTFTDLAKRGKSSPLKNIFGEILGNISKCDSTPLISIIEDIYSQLFKSYRSEYLFKNIAAQKILLGKHSINTTKMLTEFRVGESKADILMLNGTSHIYEIKSEYDNLDRLEKQVKDYQRFAEYVSIITAQTHIDKLLSITDENIGLIGLTKNGALRNIRKAASNISFYDPSVAFSSLRKKEYIQLLKDLGCAIPDVPNTKIYAECKKLFSQIDRVQSIKSLAKILKLRDHSQTQNKFIIDAPKELKAYAVSCKLNAEEKINLSTALNRSLGYHLQ